MKRIEALRLVAEASGGSLTITNVGRGWPAEGLVRSSTAAVPVSVYLGVIGESHRRRAATERRFQNPSQGSPIENSTDRLPILLGVWKQSASDEIILVGFDALRRVGRRTRQSMFVPTSLLESATLHGWAAQETGSGETIAAFLPSRLPEYCEFRAATSGPAANLEQEDQLPDRNDSSVEEMHALMRSVWTQVGRTDLMPDEHQGFLEQVYEDPRLVGEEPRGTLDKIVLQIAQVCEPDVDEEDIELFLVDGKPTRFLYEVVAAHIAQGEGEDEDVGEHDEEEEQFEDVSSDPVDSNVRNFSVLHLFQLIDRGQLDIEPAWQRKDIWPLRKKRELIRSLILGIPLPSIILHKKSGRWSIIDGKQRLTSIVKYLRNEFKLPAYPAKVGRLHEASRAFYDMDGKRSLPPDIRTSLDLQEIPALEFRDVPEARLREIFHLYNVAGVKLNAAEIRNAAYQRNPIHLVLYVLAGEGDGTTDLGVGGIQTQNLFSDQLRAVYPGSRSRYQGVDFIARYMGYSRASQRSDATKFSPPTTSAVINNFFDHDSESEDPVETAKEIIRVFDDAQLFFDISEERLAFFLRNEKGERKFNKLVATTHLVGARLLRAAIDSGVVSGDRAREAAASVKVPYPENQQRSTIWDYQARHVIGLRDALDLDPADLHGSGWPEFVEKMVSCVLPHPDPDVE